MARFSSNPGRGWRGRRVNGIYLALGLVMVALIVSVLYWGRSSGPQEAAAGDIAQGANPANDGAEPTPRLAAEAGPQQQADASEQAPQPAEPKGEPEPIQTALDASEGASRPNADVAAIVAEAMALGRSQPSKVIEVRDKLNSALSMPMSLQQRQTIQAKLSDLADDWLFGPAVFAGDTLCDTYAVQRGDLLEVIGRRHKVPYEILMQVNRIRRPQNLKAGRTIKVINGPFHAKVCRSTFTLDLYLQDTYVRTFKVGLGKPGYETPTGLWRVQQNGKLIKPTWTDPDTRRRYTATDPDYPLGSRWIALDGLDGEARGRTGFAIHGTKDPAQIGTAGSRGCIRMYNGDAILAYRLLFPVYSKVELVE